MPHIHTEPGQHDATVSMFIVRREPRAILFHKHKIVGRWMQFGGHIELHENPWQTVVHELEEEAGYKIEQLRVLQAAPLIPGLIETIHPVPIVYRSHSYPGRVPHVHTDAAFGFMTEEEPAGKPQESESQELKWFTADQLKASEKLFVPDSRTIALHLLEQLESYRAYPAAIFAS